eukprot:CAMPEP_0194265604 /NCGR_PEP_ID=MMETSP0169-20130528/787_1 /TAXON_ID=218684 /ORGANISM="Corethron pennatum, Strain L29A3" /LENGTH=540 /DNA_ID=CAMNT_0039006101 /DNA_START=190 /DNA_END=1808 /DNA_ORIENTATION=+
MPGIDEKTIEQNLPPGQKIEPLFTLPKDVLEKLSSAKSDLPDLTRWFKIINIAPKPSSDMFILSNNIQALSFVEEAYIPDLQPPPALTPDLRKGQTYLDPQKLFNGIDAEYSHKFTGGDGAGVTIYDIEYAWDLNHEDLISKTRDITILVSPGDAPVNPWPDDPYLAVGHGTGVLGELVADNKNEIGVSGISPGADIGVAAEYTRNRGTDRANAIMLAVNDGKPGDVILLEMQSGVFCEGGEIGLGPAEDKLDVYDATRVAVGNGRVVVAAAGNGAVNLDSAKCCRKYDRTNGPVGPNCRVEEAREDSGAIMVGAGGSGRNGCFSARERIWSSSFGSRVDLQGFGSCVRTTGGGWDLHRDPDGPENISKWYTDFFSGTSSASPIVAGAAANLQGIAMAKFGKPLNPLEVRRILVETGTKQTGDSAENIGPLPNLRQAIRQVICTSFAKKSKCIKHKACAYNLDERLNRCIPKGEDKCSQHHSKFKCTRGGFCNYRGGVCVHKCSGLSKKDCKNMKTDKKGIQKKICSNMKYDNPCWKCNS